MNLVAYDKVNTFIDKSKTWIEIAKKLLLSREIAFRKYVTFGKRYDKDISKTVFFVIVLDEPPVDRPAAKVLIDGYGRVKIGVKGIWEEAEFNKVSYDRNVDIKHTQHADDGDIYELRLDLCD